MPATIKKKLTNKTILVCTLKLTIFFERLSRRFLKITKRSLINGKPKPPVMISRQMMILVGTSEANLIRLSINVEKPALQKAKIE